MNLSSPTPATTPSVGKRHGKQEIVVDIARSSDSAEHPVMVPTSAENVAGSYGGDNATRAETWADARCEGDVTLAGSDDYGVVSVRRRGTRRSKS